ncbi:hypothetical protein ACLOJK_023817 [Asimina triloba]
MINVIQEISRRARKALRSVLLVTPDHENANYEPIVSFIPSIDITLDTMDLSSLQCVQEDGTLMRANCP